MTKRLLLVSVLAGLCVVFPHRFGSAVSLSFVEEPALANQSNVDIVISGLGGGVSPALGGFDIGVGFDPAFLSPRGITFGSLLGNPDLFEALTIIEIGPTELRTAEVSLLTARELLALQPEDFALATINFSGDSTGVEGLSFTHVRLSDEKGDGIDIPEPRSLFVIGFGLVIFGLVFRRWNFVAGRNWRNLPMIGAVLSWASPTC